MSYYYYYYYYYYYPGVKTVQLSCSFVVINDTTFPDIVMKTAFGVVFLKVLYALLRSLFR
jgi:hypothetical protein